MIDYRKLNAETIVENFPCTSVNEQLISLRSAKIFSQIDLNSGYHQIKIRPQDQYKTSFVLPFGQFEFCRLPFGLTNAPSSFQRVMTDILGHLEFVKIYLDDILIFSIHSV